MAEPARLVFRPLQGWTEPRTAPGQRRPSTYFRADYDDTLDLLAFEAGRVGAREAVVQLAIGEGDLRADGTPKLRAAPSHPGVVVSLDSRHGPLRYATDAYHGWRANLRAIALALQALRAVDRYGITTRGEQYTGWPADPAAERWRQNYPAVADTVRKNESLRGDGQRSDLDDDPEEGEADAG